MKLLFTTYGTEGDTRPLAALCRYLIDNGHECLLMADAGSLDGTHTLGVPTRPLAGDIKGSFRVDGARQAAGTLAKLANTHTESWLRAIVEESEGCDAIVVSGLAAFVGLSAAEYRQVEAIGAGFIPFTPTREFPSPFLPPWLSSGLTNFASHRFVNSMIWRVLRRATNAARRSICGLPPRREIWEGHPMLYGISPALLREPSDWPSNASLCGQWLLPVSDFSAHPALAQFLADGEPPIYVGFGSMTGFDTAAMTAAIVRAVDGRRTLFYAGWSGADVSRLPDNIFALGRTPHDWLFPQTALVVHHGGSGTSHSAVRAGVPSVVVPFAGDQHFWADRLVKSGVAISPRGSRRVDAQQLARAIELAGAESMREHAVRLGERMRREDGFAAALRALEQRHY